MAGSTQIPSRSAEPPLSRSYGRSRFRDSPGPGQGRLGGRSHRLRRSEGTWSRRSAAKWPGQGKLRTSRSGQPCIDRRLRAADARAGSPLIPDKQCGCDSAATPAKPRRMVLRCSLERTIWSLRSHGSPDAAIAPRKAGKSLSASQQPGGTEPASSISGSAGARVTSHGRHMESKLACLMFALELHGGATRQAGT